MLEIRDVPETNIIELTVDGKVSKREFDDVIAKIQTKIEKHGKVRVLEHVRSIGMIPPSVLWADVKFGLRNLSNFSHAAVVGDQRWLRLVTKVVKPFMSAEVRYFPAGEIEQARQWLRLDQARPAAQTGTKQSVA